MVVRSSAFPGFFPPVEITAADLGVAGQYPTEWFTDGGVYDNLSIRAFSWLMHQDAKFDQVLVSDAGEPFQILSEGGLRSFRSMVSRDQYSLGPRLAVGTENFGRRTGTRFPANHQSR